MKRQTIFKGVLALIAGLVASATFHNLNGRNITVKELSEIRMAYPFFPSEDFNPAAVYSVADQVLVEHTVAYHSQLGFRKGLMPVISETLIDRQNNRLTFRILHQIKDASGAIWSTQDICDSIASSLKGSLHLPTQSAMRQIECDKVRNEVQVDLNYVPINMESMLSKSDMSIFKPGLYPVRGKFPPGTGPYTIEESASDHAMLAANPYYPAELTANRIPKLRIDWSATHSPDFLKSLEPSRYQLVYFYGAAIPDEAIELLRQRGYQTDVYPSEWLLGVWFNAHVGLSSRQYIGQGLDRITKKIGASIGMGQPAYSMSPADRSFGLDSVEYDRIVHHEQPASATKFTLGILAPWATTPIFKKLLDLLRDEFGSNIIIKTFELSDASKMRSTGADAYLTSLGITPGDPITHYAFIQRANSLIHREISENQVEAVAMARDLKEFDQRAKDFERVLIQKRLFLPIGHFPGVVARVPYLERDENLSWSWGMQAWTYRQR